MFNSKAKKEALEGLESAVNTYSDVYQIAVRNMDELQKSRTRATKTLKNIEDFISELANAPKEFSQTMSKVTVIRKNFESKTKQLLEEGKKVEVASGTSAGAGAAAAVGVAAFAPSAAMAVAMTFGTASTGTAIATLSGAAATNAALAWLGGGALVVGGGGMAAGSTLLALAGPVGWAIGATAIIGSGVFANKKNAEVAEKAERSTGEVKKETARMRKTSITVATWEKELSEARERVDNQLKTLKGGMPRDYNLFTEDQKAKLASVINTANSISEQIQKTIS